MECAAKVPVGSLENVVDPPTSPPRHITGFDAEFDAGSNAGENLIELPPKEREDKFPPKKGSKKTPKERRRVSLDEFLGKTTPEPVEVTPVIKSVRKSPFVMMPTIYLVRDVLGFVIMDFFIQNHFNRVFTDLEKQLKKTVQSIVRLYPGFNMTAETTPSVINLMIDAVIASDDKGTELYNMLRTVLALHSLRKVLNAFKNKTLQVSAAMLVKALNYIREREIMGEFNATKFFLELVDLIDRCDGIAAMLCLGPCLRIDPKMASPNSRTLAEPSKGWSNFVLIMELDPRAVKRVTAALNR